MSVPTAPQFDAPLHLRTPSHVSRFSSVWRAAGGSRRLDQPLRHGPDRLLDRGPHRVGRSLRLSNPRSVRMPSPDAPHRPVSPSLPRIAKGAPVVTDSPNTDHDQIESAVWFISTQLGGPDRVLAHHRKMANGLCGACSSVNPVRWPCPIVCMALQADAQQNRAELKKGEGR
jgi:hypothetical protein